MRERERERGNNVSHYYTTYNERVYNYLCIYWCIYFVIYDSLVLILFLDAYSFFFFFFFSILLLSTSFFSLTEREKKRGEESFYKKKGKGLMTSIGSGG